MENEIIKELEEEFDFEIVFGKNSQSLKRMSQFILTKLKEERIKTLEKVRTEYAKGRKTLGEIINNLLGEDEYGNKITTTDSTRPSVTFY